jgi:hypothetical protein
MTVLTCRGDLEMKKYHLLGHLYEFEGSQVADQQLQEVDEDGFAKSAPKAVQPGIQIQEEQRAPNSQLNPPRLSWLGLSLDICAVPFLAWECKPKDSSKKQFMYIYVMLSITTLQHMYLQALS